MDLALELPEDEIGPIATHEQWDHALDRVAELVREHHTTILFVNTRRLVERLAHQMSERLGDKGWPRITAACRRRSGETPSSGSRPAR